MATRTVPLVPLEDELGEGDRAVDAALQRPWRKAGALSRGPELAERFLESASFDRAPWLTVAFAGGIAAWFGGKSGFAMGKAWPTCWRRAAAPGGALR